MADLTIQLVIPEASITKAKTGYFKLYPNIEKDADGAAKYSDMDWFKERLRRNIVNDIHRGLRMVKNEENAVVIDDEIVS